MIPEEQMYETEGYVGFPNQQLDPEVGSYAPGGFSLATGKYAVMANRLQLVGAERVRLAGTARLRIT